MVWSRHPSAFSDQDTDTLINLANLATIAIENARLYETERTAVRTLAEAHTKLETQYEHLRRASSVHEELTQLVLRGRGLSDLVEMVAKHTGGKVAILDAGLEILAASPDPDVLVALARRHLRSGRNRPDPARGSPPPFADPASGSWLVTRGVVAGGERLGHLCVALPHPPTGLDPVIVEQAAIVCALELTKERAVSEAQTRVRSDFLWDLLEGSISDDSEALVRARHLGYALPPKVRIMLVPVQGLDEWAGRGGTADAMDRRRESLVRAGEQLAGAAGTAQAFAARRGSLIAMVVGGSESSAQAKKLAEAVVGGLSEANPDLAFSAGLSACVALAANLEPAYRQAQHALSAIPVVAASRRVAVFDDLGVLRFLLAPADRGELVGFARRILGPLIDYDQAHGAELVRTVEVYLANDCNLQRAAEQIYVHPKTVRYRLDRAEALSGINLATQQDRFDAHLAVTIIRALALDGSDVS
jgi:sugar diacid utilization regulator